MNPRLQQFYEKMWLTSFPPQREPVPLMERVEHLADLAEIKDRLNDIVKAACEPVLLRNQTAYGTIRSARLVRRRPLEEFRVAVSCCDNYQTRMTMDIQPLGVWGVRLTPTCAALILIDRDELVFQPYWVTMPESPLATKDVFRSATEYYIRERLSPKIQGK